MRGLRPLPASRKVALCAWLRIHVIVHGARKRVDDRIKSGHDYRGIFVTKGGWSYMMTNKPNGILYVGVTSDIARRAWEHREGIIEGFTKRYGLKRLVYVERHEEIIAAIQREKTIKHWSRAWKVKLILADNPEWHDLYETLA